MSIGAVLDLLLPDFPDVSHSKIRFLEAEGLVTPSRTAAGYRRFTAYDCARLRFILTAQRDQYLPLKVIKAQLDAMPDGELPTIGSPYPTPHLVPDGLGGSGSAAAPVSPVRVRLTRADVLEQAGADSAAGDALLNALLKSGVITPIFKGGSTAVGGAGLTGGSTSFFDEHAVVILQCAQALAEYGVEPRHLRAFRSAADRQSDLIAQIAGPVVKTDKAGARDRADDLAREVAALAITLHTALVKSAVRDVLQR